MPNPRNGSVPAVDSASGGRAAPEPWLRKRDWGGLLARALCGLFALCGLVPLAVGLASRLEVVQLWAAEKTAAIVRRQIRVDASYRLRVTPWPLQIALEDVRVDSSDGGPPVLSARRIVARPRIFALLDGKPDFGEVIVEEPHVVLRFAEGKLQNLSYELPETPEGGDDLPLAAVALTNAALDVSVDDTHVRAVELDVDVTFEGKQALELSLHAGRAELDRIHPRPGHPAEDAVDEDVVCSLDLRARASAKEILVRRLALHGAADLDPAAGTRPPCDLGAGDWRRVELKLASVRVPLRDHKPYGLDARVKARLPVPIVHRFVALAPTTGWLSIDADELGWDEGAKLPRLRATIEGEALGFEGKTIARTIAGAVDIQGEVLRARNLVVGWGGGTAKIAEARLRPLDEHLPLAARDIQVTSVTLPELLQDLAGHPDAHVAWTLDKVGFKRFDGTLRPLALSGPMLAHTHGFAVHDRPASREVKRTMVAVERGTVSGTFGVTEEAIVIDDVAIVTARSRVHARVSLGYEEDLGIAIRQGSTVDLSEISPLVDLPLKGVARLTLDARGKFTEPVMDGELAITGFDIDGFPLGELREAKVHFVPLALSVKGATLLHGKSALGVPRLDLDFDNGDAGVVVHGSVDSRGAGLHLDDLFEMIKLGGDPRFAELHALAKGVADVDYVLGGRRDPCGGGRLLVRTRMDLAEVSAWGEPFDGGFVDMDYLWDDIPAGDHGLVVRVNAATLHKGSGTILARAAIDHDARLQADVAATAIPLSTLAAFQKAFGPGGKGQRRVVPDASFSLAGTLSGTLSQMEGKLDVNVSPLRIGPDTLPASRFRLRLIPRAPPDPVIGVSRCRNRLTAPRAAIPGADEVAWVYRLDGSLFGGQVELADVQLTQQDDKMLSGQLALRKLDLGALANLLPGVAFSQSQPKGQLTADVRIDELPVNRPADAEVQLSVRSAELTVDGHRLSVGKLDNPILVSGDVIRLPKVPLRARLRSGVTADLVAGGTIADLSRPSPRLGLSLALVPLDLAKLGVEIPGVSRAAGLVSGRLELGGSTSLPRLGGFLRLDKGRLGIKGLALPFEDIAVDVVVDNGEIVVRRASARAGNSGHVSLSARVPLRGLSIAEAHATIVARDVKVPVADGVKLTADALLKASYQPGATADAKATLPNIRGTVTLSQFSYTRPMTFRLDLDQLTGRHRTEVEAYHPDDDVFAFDVSVVSPRPLRITNNLIDMRLTLDGQGVRLTGTNQRFGARGKLRIEPASKIFLQGHDFVVRDGTVEFDNETRIAPRLDVHAATEYHRYAQSSDIEAAATEASVASTGGKWRIAMHAYGDTDAPQVRFSSDPPLSQDDIVLLLQVGMTRAELERGLAGSLVQSVGIEALTAVTGIDQAVRRTVPLIDEFRVGSQYSSKSGRPEPAVTVGKRITDSVRATVTSGLGESREVRSNVEWKLTPGLGVQGSYDNVNDVSSSALGNIGADLRWRLEFD